MPTEGLSSKPTPEEIEALIADMARNGDGADKRWALGKLAPETTGLTIPPPMDLHDLIARGTRLMKAMGKEWTRSCWHEAFKNDNKGFLEPAKIHEDTDAFRGFNFPRRLKSFYRQFPEAKPKGGFPRGFPAGKSEVMKIEWLKRESIKLLKEREEQKAARLAESERAHRARANATDGDEDDFQGA